MKIAVLVKQVPVVESLRLLDNGRIDRTGSLLEMNAYCRRAVSKGVELARTTGGRCTVFTLGPDSAEDVLREALAWGAEEGVLISGDAFAGSDTLATSLALASALRLTGSWDLVLLGRNSIDADTGQVGPQVAEFLGLPFAAAVRKLKVYRNHAEVCCEVDDGGRTLRVSLPAVLSTAERLSDPCKVPAKERSQVRGDRIRRLCPDHLGPGPWGQTLSPTSVGAIRLMEPNRQHMLLSGPVSGQVEQAASLIRRRNILPKPGNGESSEHLPTTSSGVDTTLERERASVGNRGTDAAVVVIAELNRSGVTRELLGEAARLARIVGGTTIAITPSDSIEDLASWGADRIVRITGAPMAEDVAAGLASWCATNLPWAILAPGTIWGREVTSRLAARLQAGLTGDAIAFDVEDNRLVAWKPAFGGRLLAAIRSSSDVQLATVRPGILPLPPACPAAKPVIEAPIMGSPRGRIRVLNEWRDDNVDRLLAARIVVAVGAGVLRSEYPLVEAFACALGAEVAASRKVTDKGWLPRARQVGITGHSLCPALYITLGISGTFNHMVGVRGAGTIIAVNVDPSAPVFEWADIGIVGDWRQVTALLPAALRSTSGSCQDCAPVVYELGETS